MSNLARDLHSKESSQDVMRLVVDVAASTMKPCWSAGIVRVGPRSSIISSAASDGVAMRGDELQLELGEGPGVEAVWQEQVVSVPDLASETRWPRWAPHAVAELGVRSMLSVRLFTHQDVVGALTMYAAEREAFTSADVAAGVAIAEHAAVAVVTAEKLEQLQAALETRTTIAEAKGTIMGKYGVDSSTAFQVMVRMSSETRQKVSAVAAKLVERHDDNPRSPLRWGVEGPTGASTDAVRTHVAP